MTEEKMVGWHQQLKGSFQLISLQILNLSKNKFEQTLGDGQGHGSLACCNPLGWQRVGHNLASEKSMAHKRQKLSFLPFLLKQSPEVELQTTPLSLGRR